MQMAARNVVRICWRKSTNETKRKRLPQAVPEATMQSRLWLRLREAILVFFIFLKRICIET
jgi:hypothetical protein